MLVLAYSKHIRYRVETFRLSVAVRWKVGAAPTETPITIVPQPNMWSSTARKDDTPLIKSFTHRAYQYTLTFGAYVLMRRPVQPITLLAARAPCTAACRPRPWCCSSWQPHRTAVRLCSVQGRHSATNSSKYIETRTKLIARDCSPLEKGVRHHSAGMLFPRLSLHVNTRTRPNGHQGNDFSAVRTSIKKPLR